MKELVFNVKSVGIIFLLIIFPLFANSFWLVQIGSQTFIYGIIVLGLTFLAGFGGIVSLAQMVVAGFSGYLVAILGVNSANLGLGWHWIWVVLIAICLGTIFGTLVGLISVRTEGIYTIMITLAIAVGFFYFTRQNYAIFNGFNGYAGIKAPNINDINLREPIYFYYLCLGIALICYFGIAYIIRSTFGIALQGVRDSERRMYSLGFSAIHYRILAYTIASFLAAIGGVLLVWMNDRVDPSSIGIGPTIDVLIMAVVGGVTHPLGAFVGTLAFILLDNFAIDLINRERFNTVIGLFFLLVLLFSPNGIMGMLSSFNKHRS